MAQEPELQADAVTVEAGGADMIIVSYGAGTNSTAMLVGMKERGIRPDVITFADTHAEKPKTYEQVSVVTQWCVKRLPRNKHSVGACPA